MPHPERACESALGSKDGLVMFESVVAALTGVLTHVEVGCRAGQAVRAPAAVGRCRCSRSELAAERRE